MSGELCFSDEELSALAEYTKPLNRAQRHQDIRVVAEALSEQLGRHIDSADLFRYYHSDIGYVAQRLLVMLRKRNKALKKWDLWYEDNVPSFAGDIQAPSWNVDSTEVTQSTVAGSGSVQRPPGGEPFGRSQGNARVDVRLSFGSALKEECEMNAIPKAQDQTLRCGAAARDRSTSRKRPREENVVQSPDEKPPLPVKYKPPKGSKKNEEKAAGDSAAAPLVIGDTPSPLMQKKQPHQKTKLNDQKKEAETDRSDADSGVSSLDSEDAKLMKGSKMLRRAKQQKEKLQKAKPAKHPAATRDRLAKPIVGLSSDQPEAYTHVAQVLGEYTAEQMARQQAIANGEIQCCMCSEPDGEMRDCLGCHMVAHEACGGVFIDAEPDERFCATCRPKYGIDDGMIGSEDTPSHERSTVSSEDSSVDRLMNEWIVDRSSEDDDDEGSSSSSEEDEDEEDGSHVSESDFSGEAILVSDSDTNSDDRLLLSAKRKKGRKNR